MTTPLEGGEGVWAENLADGSGKDFFPHRTNERRSRSLLVQRNHKGPKDLKGSLPHPPRVVLKTRFAEVEQLGVSGGRRHSRGEFGQFFGDCFPDAPYWITSEIHY
jgi:hypothetical protein